MCIGLCIEATRCQCALLYHPLPYSMMTAPLTEAGALLIADSSRDVPVWTSYDYGDAGMRAAMPGVLPGNLHLDFGPQV